MRRDDLELYDGIDLEEFGDFLSCAYEEKKFEQPLLSSTEIITISMILTEYYARTGDRSVLPIINKLNGGV